MCVSSKKRIAPSSSISHGVPIVCMRSQRQPPTSGAVTVPVERRTHGSSGSCGTSPPARPQDVEQPVLRERRRLDGADAHQPVAVDRRHPGALADRDVERGEVRVADERLRVLGDEVEVEVRDRLRGAEPALERLDDVDLGIGEERVQVLAARLRVPAT